MEKMLTTQQALNKLRLQASDSPILPIIAPLFNTLDYQDEYSPNRVSENDGYTQLLWETEVSRCGNFEQICLTLSRATLSMTVALSHRHNNTFNSLPAIHDSALSTRRSSSLIMNADSHMLYETNQINGVLLGTYHDNEAISRFTPELTHCLAAIGLYGYGQNTQHEVG